jgi:hypothetical protein
MNGQRQLTRQQSFEKWAREEIVRLSVENEGMKSILKSIKDELDNGTLTRKK